MLDNNMAQGVSLISTLQKYLDSDGPEEGKDFIDNSDADGDEEDDEDEDLVTTGEDDEEECYDDTCGEEQG